MKRTIFLYAGALAGAAFALQWAESRYFTKVYTTEIYIALLAIAFLVRGIWLGRVLGLGLCIAAIAGVPSARLKPWKLQLIGKPRDMRGLSFG